MNNTKVIDERLRMIAVGETSGNPDDSDEIFISPEMIEAGFRVLVSSGITDEPIGADKLLVAEIYCAMSEIARLSLSRTRAIPNRFSRS